MTDSDELARAFAQLASAAGRVVMDIDRTDVTSSRSAIATAPGCRGSTARRVVPRTRAAGHGSMVDVGTMTTRKPVPP